MASASSHVTLPYFPSPLSLRPSSTSWDKIVTLNGKCLKSLKPCGLAVSLIRIHVTAQTVVNKKFQRIKLYLLETSFTGNYFSNLEIRRMIFQIVKQYTWIQINYHVHRNQEAVHQNFDRIQIFGHIFIPEGKFPICFG